MVKGDEPGKEGKQMTKILPCTHLWGLLFLSKRRWEKGESIRRIEAEICGGCYVEYAPWEGWSGETSAKLKKEGSGQSGLRGRLKAVHTYKTETKSQGGWREPAFPRQIGTRVAALSGGGSKLSQGLKLRAKLRTVAPGNPEAWSQINRSYLFSKSLRLKF